MHENIYEIREEEMRIKSNFISGNDEIRNKLKKIINMIFEEKKEEKNKINEFLGLNGNILLYGKPGTGKTSICYESMLFRKGISYYHINASSLISEKLGKTSKIIDELFKVVIEKSKKYEVILLFEEIEALLPNRSSTKELDDMKRALTVFMHYLDKKINNLVIICTTNFKENLDIAIVRRFSFQYEIMNKDTKAFTSFLVDEKNPFNNEFLSNEQENVELAKLMIEKGYTFSDLKHFMRELYISEKNVTAKNIMEIIEGGKKWVKIFYWQGIL